MTTQTFATSFLVLLCIGYSRGQWGLENLGEQINAQVQQSLAPLQNLGQQINEQVQREVAPLNNFNFLGQRPNTYVNNRNSWNPLGNNWSPFGNNWNNGLPGNLNGQLPQVGNLGEQINAQVQQSLKPVRILESTLKVKFGTGGTTVATYSPGGKRLIIKESSLFACDGHVSDTNGACSVPLKKLRFANKEEFCYSTTKTIVNNWYCLGSTGPVSTYFVNGEFTCDSTDGSPVLLIKEKDYRKLCDNVATSAKYKYYTYSPLKDFGNGLECSGYNPQICTYSENFTRIGSQTVRGSTIIYNK